MDMNGTKRKHKMKFTKLEAIKELQEIGSHTIFLEDQTELVSALCKPFNFLPHWETFTVDPEPWGKGPQPIPSLGINWGDQFDGVNGFWLAHTINHVCDGKPATAIGRGTAYRQNLNNAKEALGITITLGKPIEIPLK
jgi:hypothetical protein